MPDLDSMWLNSYLPSLFVGPPLPRLLEVRPAHTPGEAQTPPGSAEMATAK